MKWKVVVQGIARSGWNVIKIVWMAKWFLDVMKWWLVGEKRG